MAKIYLISPPKINLQEFSLDLKNALKTSLVPVFQLRLKDYPRDEIEKFAKELKKICHDNNCLFLLNDNFDIALKIGADGVHMGSEDGSVAAVRSKSSQDFIIGASCYDSRHLAIEAAEQGADYLSFGTFFSSQTKNSKGKPTNEIIEWSHEMTDLPIVAIGGITDQNCSILIKSRIDFIAVISYVWQHPAGAPAALKTLNQAICKAENSTL